MNATINLTGHLVEAFVKMNFGQKIGYGLLIGSCRIMGLLPDWFLYRILGPFICFVLHRIVHYRLEVVRENLKKSFPEKSEEELQRIEKDFYCTLSEIFVDTFKLSVISRRKILRRMTYRNYHEVEEKMQGRSWISAMSHYGSWELTVNYPLFTDCDVLAVYRPLHSKIFDNYYLYARSRFGTRPVAMNDIYKEVIRSGQPGGRPVAVALIADQTPPRHEIKHWYRFLGQDTPFFSGMEKMALRFGMPVWFLHVRQTAPHTYEGEFIQIYDGSEPVREREITERYIDRLEKMIREAPHLWMWSHKRWKHKREEMQ